MVRKLLITCAAAAMCSVSSPAIPSPDATIRIATWDLHDLWHEPGKPLRQGARTFTKADLDALRKRAGDLNADIVALQGVGSKKAVHLIFSARDYYVVFSRELAIRMQADRDILTNPARRRVYTAFAIRRSGNIRLLARENILELADPSPQLGTSRPQGQSGLAIRVRINKRPAWILNARLVTGCRASSEKTDDDARTSSRKERMCTALKDQIDLINHWKSLKNSINEPVIMAVALPKVQTTKTRKTSKEVAVTSAPVGDIWNRLLARSETSPRARRKGQKRAVRFALTNRTIAPVDNRVAGALQPNTVPLTGPSRPPGQRLVPLPKRTATPANKNFVIDALNDFAKTALQDRTPKPDETPKRPTLVTPAVPALKKVRLADGAARPVNNKHFVQFPAHAAPTACHKNALGDNYLIVTRALKDTSKNASFAMAKSKASTLPSGVNQPDCAVYLDIPRQKS